MNRWVRRMHAYTFDRYCQLLFKEVVPVYISKSSRWECSKITTNSDDSHEIKRHLLLGRKATANLDSLLKSRDIILLTKVHIVKAIVFPVVKYECESWLIKKAERQRMDACELWYWRRLLRVT